MDVNVEFIYFCGLLVKTPSHMHRATHIQLSYCSSHWSTLTGQTQSDVPIALQTFVAPLSSRLTIGGRLIQQDTTTGFWRCQFSPLLRNRLCIMEYLYLKTQEKLFFPFPLGSVRRNTWCSMWCSGTLVMRITQALSVIQIYLLSPPQVPIQHSHT